jgi:hypothetical protein
MIEVTEMITNPTYSRSQSDVGDLGLLILAEAPVGITPATLPTLGLLDELAVQNGLKNATFTVVGYGVQDRVVGGGQPFFTDANPVIRGYAVESFLSLNKGFLRLSQNPSTGDAGACYGDSGGPNFLTVNGQQILVAVTVTGDAVCRATNVVYRLDNETAQTFLAPYCRDGGARLTRCSRSSDTPRRTRGVSGVRPWSAVPGRGSDGRRSREVC